MAGKCAWFVQAEPGAHCEQKAGGSRRLLPEMLHERLPENSPQEAAHLVYDPREQCNSPFPVVMFMLKKLTGL